MARKIFLFATLLALGACSQSEETPPPAARKAAADTPVERARFQLESRLGGTVTLENLREGVADSGRPLICGTAVLNGERTPFVMGDFLILEEDASPEQMVALNKPCTKPVS